MNLVLAIKRLGKRLTKNLDSLVLGSYLLLYLMPGKVLLNFLQIIPTNLKNILDLEILFHANYSFLFYLILFKRIKSLRQREISISIILGSSLMLELLQSLVGRHTDARDFVLDILGGFSALGFVKILEKLSSKAYQCAESQEAQKCFRRSASEPITA
jgi:hypothetical protein